MKPKIRRLILFCILLSILCTVSGVWGYWKYASPTRIAFVNYPEYVLAEDLDQPINPAIEVSVLPGTAQLRRNPFLRHGNQYFRTPAGDS